MASHQAESSKAPWREEKVHSDADAEEEEEEEEEDVWADAQDHDADVSRSGPPQRDQESYTIDELQDLLHSAETLKLRGNQLFKTDDAQLDAAAECYQQALDRLPSYAATPPSEPPKLPPTGLVEVTDAEADELQAQEAKRNAPESQKRREVDEEITQMRKALWANLGAVYVRKGDDKRAIEACTAALAIDPDHVKALQRRAGAGERLGTWTSLTQAQEDYTRLTSLAPTAAVRSALRTLPTRIATQQEKEKDEMMGKLKELGNGLLGKFGLSTDMFKFDPQPGGGYSMRFER